MTPRFPAPVARGGMREAMGTPLDYRCEARWEKTSPTKVPFSLQSHR